MIPCFTTINDGNYFTLAFVWQYCVLVHNIPYQLLLTISLYFPLYFLYKVFLCSSAVVSLLLLVEVVEVLEGGEAGHLEGGAHTVVCCAVNSGQLNLGVESDKVKVSILYHYTR